MPRKTDGNKSNLKAVDSLPPSSDLAVSAAARIQSIAARSIKFDWPDLWKDNYRGRDCKEWPDDVVKNFIEFMLAGASMSDICREHGVSYTSLFKRIRQSDALMEYYKFVQQESIHAYADLMMRVALEIDDPRRGDLVVKVMQWTAERRNRIYAARTETHHSGAVSTSVEYKARMPRRAGDDGGTD